MISHNDQYRLQLASITLDDVLKVFADWYWKQDLEFRFTLVRGNTETPAISEHHLGKRMWDIATLHSSSEQSWDAHKTLLNARQAFVDLETRYDADDGKTLYLSTCGYPLFSADGAFIGYHGITKNITQRVCAERALKESEVRFRSLIDFSSDWYWELDEHFRFSYLTQSAFDKAGHLAKAIHGLARWELKDSTPLVGTWHDHQRMLEAHLPFRDFEYRRIADDGNLRYTNASGMPVFDARGNFTGYRGVGSDITARKLSEERITYLATHDGLTGLTNRTHFSENLNQTIDIAKRYMRKFALVFIDLDRFKLINDTLGHDAGDTLLIEVAKRLKAIVRSSDVVARLGGDEFIVLLQEINKIEGVHHVADKIVAAMASPFALMESEYRISASVGISLYPIHAQDEQSLMQNADAAMYKAKEGGRNNYQIFSEDIRTSSEERIILEEGLSAALERKEFFLHYQARCDLKSGEITGVEALLRWMHPTRGLVMPLEFIPLAEQTGLIVSIGEWVLNEACAQSVAWQKAGLPAILVSVNLSDRQLADPNLLHKVSSALHNSGLQPHCLELELTEGMALQNIDRTVRMLGDLKSLGVRLAIDDFGVGFSSLARLKDFPIDNVKIDHSFIRYVGDSAQEQEIASAVIALGKTLDLNIIAEGVETKEQQEFLRGHGCNEIQGFLFSEPIAPDQFFNLALNSLNK